uniref:(northern house mosquito) hypothetical protein n=1 Tax=Culex pipiens TaxID=7175 RepID=A0A8D8P6D2_CULPI
MAFQHYFEIQDLNQFNQDTHNKFMKFQNQKYPGHSEKESIMEIISEGRNFQLVKDESLHEVLEVLQKFFPYSIKFHQTIRTYLKDKVWQFYFYISKAWPEDPICLHFPGCTFTLDKMSLIENEDILFSWTEPIYMNFTHVGIMNKMDQIFHSKVNGGLIGNIYGDIYVHEFPGELELELETLPPSEASMKPLQIDNVKDIYDLYPANDIESIELFEKLFNQLPGFGIFSRNNSELAAWSLQSYYGGMFSMQTKPEFRRKGYGIQLAQSLTKLVIHRGYLPFVVIRPENNASRSLYTKLGFRKAFETVRGVFKPNTSSVEDDKENEEKFNQCDRDRNKN